MVIRRIDDLGRVQLPKDYRKVLDIHEGDELVIELEDGYMSVKKEEKKIGEEGMERLTKETIGCFKYTLKDHKVKVGDFGEYDAFFDYSMAVKRLGEYEDTGLTPEQIQAQQQEIDRLQQWVDDLQSGMYVNCVYCGHRYGMEKDTPVSMADVLKEHIEHCHKHPMSAFKQQIKALTADKDEQAGQIMRLENLLRRIRPILRTSDIYRHALAAIDALLGDEKVFSFAHCAYEFRPATCKGIGVNCDTCGHGKLIERVSEDRGGAKDGK